MYTQKPERTLKTKSKN